jgi:hypothetical protein
MDMQDGWTLEGIACYVFPNSNSGILDLHSRNWIGTGAELIPRGRHARERGNKP